MSAVIPSLLSVAKYIPASTAIRLIEKVTPKLRRFFSDSLARGFTAHQMLEFLNDRISDKSFREQLDALHGQNMLTSEEKMLRKTEKTKEFPGKLMRAAAGYGIGSLLDQNEEAPPQAESQEQSQQPEMAASQQAERTYDPMAGLSKYPELVQFIQREVHKGKDPMVVAQTAKKSPKLSPMVQMIEREIEEPFESLIGRLFSTFKGSQQAQVQQKTASRGLSPEAIRAMQEFLAK